MLSRCKGKCWQASLQYLKMMDFQPALKRDGLIRGAKKTRTFIFLLPFCIQLKKNDYIC